MLDSTSEEDLLVCYALFWQHDERGLLPKRRIAGVEKQTERIGSVSDLTCAASSWKKTHTNTEVLA